MAKGLKLLLTIVIMQLLEMLVNVFYVENVLQFVQKNELKHIRQLQYYTTGRFMELDMDARRNLELTETLRSKEKKGTLLWVLDKTHTAMGGRLLRSWLEKPLLDLLQIERRQTAVEELVNATVCRGELIEALKAEGFEIEEGIAEIPTAFTASRMAMLVWV